MAATASPQFLPGWREQQQGTIARGGTRCDAWDSRFGQNYWFTVGGPPQRFPSPSVAYRESAVTQPEMVNALSQQATKVDAFVSNPSGGVDGMDLQTRLDLVAWVQESKYGASAWIDLHVPAPVRFT
jgi:hypothetical protein